MKALKLLTPIIFCLSIFNFNFAQGFEPPASTSKSRLEAVGQRETLKSESLINNIPFRNVGPTVMSGRVVDVDVNPEDPSIFYVAYASGGLWKTENNGTTFTPIFDNEAVMTIGDIAVDWKSGTIIVGTGEVNSSRSSYAGVGLYYSNDGGKTWSNIGLEDSHHIGRVLINPDNSDDILVASMGHLYSKNKNRGIYRSMDGGKSWSQSLFINDNTGVIDIVRDPSNSNVLYAASWERIRKAWNFQEAGPGSGIYRSEDGGSNWELVTKENSGFPIGEGTGRIGLAIYHKDGQNKLYALLDNYNRRPVEEAEPAQAEILTKEMLKEMSAEDFLALEDDKINGFLKEYRFGREYSAKRIKQMIRKNEIKPLALVEYVEDANALLFDTPVIGAEVYLSEDEGKSWKKTHEDYIDFLYNSYGYYFGLVQVSPNDPEKLYIGGVPLLRSDDGGKTWLNINGENVHSDHHSLWVNGNRDGHLINGNDGGINISYDDGENWIKCNAPSVGQFYYVNVDMAEPYNVYGGLQDNGVWVGPSTYSESKRWHNSGQYPYKGLLGGDGMQVQIDSRDNNTVYTGLQFGNYYRVQRNGRDRKFITPKHELGERPFRWNWQTPILISPHNQDIIYMGSNFLHRSFNKGESFEKISMDLTLGGRKGDVPYGTLTSIDESKLRFGLIYTGSDDGLVHITKDGGNSWNKISSKLPQNMWVSRIQASSHEESRVYLSLNGYRWDDFTPYLYISENYGENWKRIGLNLPHEAINVVKEDPSDPSIIYVGTDHGVYVSFDMGNSFTIMSDGLPATPVHDLVIHSRDKDLIVGTHGRSIYIANIEHLQQLNAVVENEVHLFELEEVRRSSRWGMEPNIYIPETEPEYIIPAYSKAENDVVLTIKAENGKVLNSVQLSLPKGISYQKYNLSIDPETVEELSKSTEIEFEAAENGKFYLPKGKYTFTLTLGESSSSQLMEVK